jgi:GH15 family glucan-1,4-alpha-glucosidase
VVRLVDFMPIEDEDAVVDVVRLVEGVRGEVSMATELVLRFDYGRTIPWVRKVADGLVAIAGPDALHLHTPVELEGQDFRTVGRFTVRAGETVPFRLTFFLSYEGEPAAKDPQRLLAETAGFWQRWTGQCKFEESWREPVMRSLITLKALTYAPAGGIAAAGTTSLPEQIGGPRNWDYRYCWIRDATFTLYAFMLSGLQEEARRWREWLLRVAAGKPSQLQILYGVAGERRITEEELPWLAGYENSRPVRIGNAAHDQLQLDVYGELFDALHSARKFGIPTEQHAWAIQKRLLDYLEGAWQLPDQGIWEMRGPARHFTHSKVMAWVAADRSVKAVERFGLEGPAAHWRQLRDAIHADVCAKGFDAERNSFVQYYGGDGLDAALLLIPLVGFLKPDDPRMVGTVAAIQRELTHDGLVKRYATEESVDGLKPGEATFITCSYWLVDNLAMLGRQDEARALFEQLLALRNDLGLLAEEYDPVDRRQLGNFPQAFSHVGLINSAHNLTAIRGPAEERAEGAASSISL